MRLGVLPSVSSELLATAIANTRTANPGLRFVITEAPASDLVASLMHSVSDLTFSRVLDLEIARELRVVNIYAEYFAIVSRSGDPCTTPRRRCS